MQQIINCIIKNSHRLLFLLLLGISFSLVIKSHSYHRSEYVNSANAVTGAYYEKVNEVNEYFSLKQKNKDFVIMLVVSIALILCGLYIILKSNLVLQTVGIVMMIYSAIEIFGYIFAKKENIIFTTEEIKKELIRNGIPENKIGYDRPYLLSEEIIR